MTESGAKGKIFVAYHKPHSAVKQNFLMPIHAGRACTHINKDSHAQSTLHIPPMLKGMMGDDTGENISERNHEYNECTVLYWIWKNVDLDKLEYIGLFQYRRYLILNNFFEHAKDNREKRAYKCVHVRRATSQLCHSIGLSEKNILDNLQCYDCIVPYASNLEATQIASPYEDWVRAIPGVHIDDLILLEEYMKSAHPEQAMDFNSYLNSPRKLMYHIFITKPETFKKYCAWLFDILFKVEPLIDTSLYSTNGKRTLGYLAEILYGFYFTQLQKEYRVKECGVAFIDK